MLPFAPETLPRLTCVEKTNKISGAFRRRFFIKNINIAPARLPAIFSKYIFPAKFPALRLDQERQWFHESRYFFRKRSARRTRHETGSRLGPSHFFKICFSGGISGAPSGPRKTKVSLKLSCFEKNAFQEPRKRPYCFSLGFVIFGATWGGCEISGVPFRPRNTMVSCSIRLLRKSLPNCTFQRRR